MDITAPAPQAEALHPFIGGKNKKSYEVGHRRKEPANGYYYVAILVGGPADIYRELSKWLAETRGMVLRYHRPGNETRSDRLASILPKDVDLVICLKDIASHRMLWGAKEEAKRKQVDFISTRRHRTRIGTALTSHGYESRGDRQHLPEAIISTLIAHPEEEEDTIKALPPPKVEAAAPVVTITHADMKHANECPDLGLLLRQLRLRMKFDSVKSVMLTATEQTVQYAEEADA